MKSLFIIGNGFDLSHRLRTTYEDFHQYLQTEYPDASGDEFTMPEPIMMPDGDVIYDDDVVVSFLLRLISNAEPNGDKWSDLENSLGYLNFDEYFDSIPDILDEDGDLDFWKNMYNTEDVASNLVIPTQRITGFFSDWINTIEINEATRKDDFASLINKESDLFLTFNYTNTLEILYGAKNVCHIHGKQGGSLLLGHGNDTDNSEENMGRYTGSENALQEIQDSLRKNTAGAIKKHQDFFDNLSSDVDKIYSYGFSFSKVDQIYIIEICKRLKTTDVIWYLNDFDNIDQREQYKDVIRSCGFKGHFSTYHIS
ncbi:bacteriophage abortive infection AbiH family protein [Brevibacillus dissolubilis]|uniref:bacteriophage abortive infection AbiH family protein n=1 Tax=Brevibacillus dissolubilis TaxID=1844116 RepID=UPI0011164653|nr:bacteriophage abortive infection AbiH family protein [Brevibacillus dissolubilis]